MKNVLIILFFFIGNIAYGQFPELVVRTLQGKLDPNDFEDQKTYMVNIDTLKFSKETLSGEFTFYNDKKEMIDKITKSFVVLKDKNIDYFKELKNNLFFQPREIHWFMILEDYRVDWWFSKTIPNKLETITLVKRKTGA